MATRPTDSQNRAVRAVERWKRGIVAFIIVGLVAAAGTILAALPFVVVFEIMGLTGWNGLAFAAGALIVAPWMLGNRSVLRHIGSLSAVSDD